MANDGREENGAGTSMDTVGSSASGNGNGNGNGNGSGSGSGSGGSTRGGEAGAELRSWDQVLDNATPSTSPPYWDTDDDDDPGPRPADLYGKFTWKIEKFSEISKRELRSNVFEVGGYRWYILVYPQGCDVCNHLSLFLCVSDYDKLLPGWSHFAQFTIAVVNKDPKKSKYSDTLHRFCKKEHDWGWKKFMELSKVSDGFIVADILVIKAQVQVIRENSHRPFRCLDCQYRRELVRVYLTNVEGICRRFVEEKREKLGKLIEDNGRWSSFRAFWSAMEENVRQRLSREKTDVILKAIVKRFFNEKEVTSTLVMDALYSGCKALNYRSRNKKEKRNSVEVDSTSFQVVWVEKDTFVLSDDVLTLLEKAATEPLPPFKEDKGPQNRTKDCSGDDFAKDNVERDERRLTELGKRTIEIFVLAHLFSNHVEVAYREAIALKMQEELILEEEAAGQAEIEFRAKREAAEKEKRSKKKQAKQKRNNRKDKNRGREEKGSSLVQDKDQQENSSRSRKLNESCLEECATPNLASLGTAEEDDDLSGLDTTDDVVGTLGPAVEDGDLDRTDWDRDGSETHQVMEASFSGDVSTQPVQSCRVGRKHQVTIDDSSSTCSTDSLASVVVNASYKGRPSLADRSQSLNRGKTKIDGERYDKDSSLVEIDNFRRGASTDLNGASEASSSAAGLNAETVILSLKERVQWLEQRLVEKEEEVVLLQEKLSMQHHHVDDDRPNKQLQDRTADCCFTKDSELSSSLHLDEGKHDSSRFPADGASMDSNKPCSQVELRANHVPPNIVPNQRSNLPKSSSDKNNVQLVHALGKHDQLKSPTHQTNNTESSLPSQNSKACTDENLSSVSGQSFAHFSGGSNEVAGISRPSSAPLIPAGPRPAVPVVSIQSQTIPFLSRSVSASGRLGVGDSMASNSMSLSQSSQVPPSYKMAAVGKNKSTYAGHVPLSVSSANTASPSQGSTASHSSGFMQNSLSSSVLPPCTIPCSPQSSHRMDMHNEYSSGRTSCDASSSSSGAVGSYVRKSQLSFLIGPEKEQRICRAANQSERPVGFTFGSVTPEMLNRQRSHGHMLDVEDSNSRVQEKSFRVDQLDHQTSLLDQHIHQQPQGGKNLKVFQVHSELDGHDIRVQQAAMNDLGMQGPPMHVYPSTDVRQVSPIMSEEVFPHIDIINDLLDDEHYRGKALSAMLQHPGGQHLNRRIPLTGLERRNSGHLLPEVNLLKGDRVEISRLHEDGLFQLHSSSDPSSIGLRESLQMVPPYAHSLYGQSYSQQGSIFEGIPPHHWPISNGDFSGGNIGSNGYGGLNTPMAYPMHGNHISLGDCSNFTTGQNDYTIFSPRKDL